MLAEWHLPLVETKRYAFVAPTAEDVAHIAANLRSGDAEEAHATFGHRRYGDALRVAVAASLSAVVAVTPYGEPVAIVGVTTLSLLSNKGCPWMVATPQADRFRSALIKQGRAYTRAMLEEFQTLENHVDARNLKSVAWLQHLGFEIGPAEPYGPLGLMFHRFRIER